MVPATDLLGKAPPRWRRKNADLHHSAGGKCSRSLKEEKPEGTYDASSFVRDICADADDRSAGPNIAGCCRTDPAAEGAPRRSLTQRRGSARPILGGGPDLHRLVRAPNREGRYHARCALD